VENETISYELSYEGLEGTPVQAHIHFGQSGVNGNVSVFLCANLATPPTPTPPACPASPATVTGTLTAANVLGLTAGQGIEAGEFDELARAIRKGLAYANVHSSRFPGGEVRGQIDDISRK
jgi:CHRD domain